MKRNAICKAIIALAVALAFIMPGAATFANIGTFGIVPNSENTGGLESMVESTTISDNSDNSDNTETASDDIIEKPTSFPDEILEGPVLMMDNDFYITERDDSIVSMETPVHNLDTGLNYTTIQGAVDATETLDGHTILVDVGIYYENVLVTKSLALKGADRDTTIIDASGSGFCINIGTGVPGQGTGIANGASISDFTGRNGDRAAFRIVDNSYCSIMNCTAYNVTYGGVGQPGIYVTRGIADNNIVKNCEVYNCDYGIYVYQNPRNTTIIDCNCHNNTMSGGGAYIWVTKNTSIINCDFYNNTGPQGGVVIHQAEDTRFMGCNFYDNSASGAYPILVYSPDCSFDDCNFYNNGNYGLYLYDSSSGPYVTVTDCNSWSNKIGIGASGINGTITGCNIYDNVDYGIQLGAGTSGNLIYDNYFDNAINAYDDGNNIWNISKTAGTNILGDPYLGGNYWNDYAGEDLDDDGLGDTLLPYNCSGNITTGGDWLPLVSIPKPVHNLDTGLNYLTIQGAIDAVETLDDHTILVDAGIYYENVLVTKNLTLQGADRDTTIIDAGGTQTEPVRVEGRNGVQLSEFTMRNGRVGVYLKQTSYSSVVNCTFDNNVLIGLYLRDGANNNIVKNCDSYNGKWGFYVYMNANNSLINCNSYNNTISGGDNIHIWVTENTSLIGCSFSGAGMSVYLHQAEDTRFIDCTFSNSGIGVKANLYYSTNTTFDNCDFYKNNIGLEILTTKNYCTVTNSNFYDNNIGLSSWLTGYLDQRGAANNTITGCNFYNNAQYGIRFNSTLSRDNIIYNNYFDNANNVLVEGSPNTWNISKTLGTNILGDPYLGGNYWSDYLGVDIDADGLGDTLLPYNCGGNITGTGGDWLPLVPIPKTVHNLDTGLNYITIQAAIDAVETLDGHTILIDAGVYFENVIVNKGLTLQGADRDTTIVDGTGINGHVVYALNADNVHIRDLTTRYAVNYPYAGIRFVDSSYGSIVNCTSYGNGGIGIYLRNGASDNIVKNCETYDNRWGIYLMGNVNNTIIDCTSYNNTDSSFHIWGQTDNISIINGDFSNSQMAAYLHNCENTIFTGCTFSNSGHGLWANLYYPKNTTINNCDFYNNSHGLHILTPNNNLTVTNSNFYDNTFGIAPQGGCANNTITGCRFYGNSQYGIWFDSLSRDNIVYNNYFDNVNNVLDEGGPNIWNISKTSGTNIIGGPFLGGNYWNDYTGVDNDDDGLGDTLLPYNCSGNITTGGDWLPLAFPDTTPPEITDNTPSSATTGDLFIFSANVTDNIAVSQVYVEYWYNAGGHTNVSMGSMGGNTWEKEIVIQHSLLILHYIISAKDIFSNWNNTGIKDVTVTDNDGPEISNVQANPSIQGAGGYVNISADVTDNVEVDEVYLHITDPSSIEENLSITQNKIGDTYYCDRMYTTVGIYHYFIWANDTQGNTVVSGTYSFVIMESDKPVSEVDPLPTWETTVPFKVTATAYDNTGVATVTLWSRYSSNGVDWTEWTAYGTDTEEPWSWSFTGSDGYYEFYSIAVDTLNNVEDPPATADTSTGIDTVKPVTVITLDGTVGDNDWFTSDVIVTLSATDTTSGIGSTWYKLDSSYWNLYATPFTVSSAGEHTIEYYSLDGAGNGEDIKTKDFKIDKTPPTTTHELEGVIGDEGWFVSNVTVTLSATDATSGVNYTKYICGGEWTTYVDPFVITENGEYTLIYGSVDLAGNVESTKEVDFKILHDIEPPVTIHAFNGDMGENGWYVSDVVILLSATDNSSGVDYTMYQLGEGEWQEYTGPIVVSDDGEYILKYYSVDNVGNTENTIEAIFKIDQTVPTINLTVEKTGFTKWLLTATVNDTTSGIAKVEFYLNNESLGEVTESPYEWEVSEKGTAYATAFDNAGNDEKSDEVPVSVSQGQPQGSSTTPVSRQILSWLFSLR